MWYDPKSHPMPTILFTAMQDREVGVAVWDYVIWSSESPDTCRHIAIVCWRWQPMASLTLWGVVYNSTPVSNLHEIKLQRNVTKTEEH